MRKLSNHLAAFAINLIAKIPGVPFTIDTIIERGTGITASTIDFVTLIPNQTQGKSINPTNNFMGGFAVIKP